MPFLEDERISVALSAVPVRVQICLKSGKDCRQATCQSCSMLFIAAISGCPVCLSPLFPPPRPAVLRPPPTPPHATRKIAGETNATSVIFTSVLLTSLMDVSPPFLLPSLARENTRASYIFRSASRFWHRPLFFHGAKEQERRDKSGWWIKGGGSRWEGNGYDPNSRRIERIVSCWSIDFFFFSRSKTSIFVTMIFISWCDGKKMMVTGIEEFFWLIDDEFCNNFI